LAKLAKQIAFDQGRVAVVMQAPELNFFGVVKESNDFHGRVGVFWREGWICSGSQLRV
jgi:hypothetical protein